MHRTERSLFFPREPLADTDLNVDSALFTATDHDCTCGIFGPLHYESGYAYPLIVWLHGPGCDERQLMRVMPLVSMRNYVAIAPRGVCISDSGEKPGCGYDWCQTEEGISLAEQRIYEGIRIAREKFSINPRRIFLAGFGSGGTMAFRVAMSHSSRFGGVLSLCGPFPTGNTPLGHLTEVRQLPVLLAVGRDSLEYPSAEVCENLRLFHTAGLSITLRQYPCGHELSPQMLTDIDRWIIEQITCDERS